MLLLACQVVSRSKPNPAHLALAAFERKCERQGKRLTLITQARLLLKVHVT